MLRPRRWAQVRSGPAASRHAVAVISLCESNHPAQISVSGATLASRPRYHYVIGGHRGRRSLPALITAAPARAPGTRLLTRPLARTAYHQPTWVCDGAARMAGHELAG